MEMLGYMQEPGAGHRWLVVRQSKIWRPPTDVYETDAHVIVKVEVAGMQEGDFAVALNARTLSISGVRRDPAEKLAYQQMEILYGEFETEVYLPWTVDEDSIEATYQDGFLSVRLPKSTPRHIPIVRLPEAPA
jgi:HSP20 family protein